MANSQSASAAMTETRSIRNGSVTGLVFAATNTSISTFATAGRMNQFRRGSTWSMRPFPFASRLQLTLSPTSGEVPSSRNLPRALHSSSFPSVST